ncbi:MAG: transcriptional repressor [Nitrospirae bacterium]|nr:transcriptional repressor [Nitrospirota bacterium]
MSERVDRFLPGRGLKTTRQRQAVVRVFLHSHRHLSAEELHSRVRAVYPRIGYATVYRTLRLLVEAGLAEERQFGDGRARFESALHKGHHDHLICVKCGRIAEFENPRIEELQATAARRRGFKVRSHKLEIYGLCPQCR